MVFKKRKKKVEPEVQDNVPVIESSKEQPREERTMTEEQKELISQFNEISYFDMVDFPVASTDTMQINLQFAILNELVKNNKLLEKLVEEVKE